MIGYALFTAADDPGSRFGAGAVMLAFDGLDLEGGEERLGDGVIRHDPVRPMERPSPGSVTDVHAGS
jgi:hypothetical protein